MLSFSNLITSLPKSIYFPCDDDADVNFDNCGIKKAIMVQFLHPFFQHQRAEVVVDYYIKHFKKH